MIINGVHLNLIHVDKKGNGFSRLAYSLSCFATWCTPKINIQCLLSFNIVVDIGLMQTAYTTSEAMGLVSVCVDIDSAQLARNVSVTLRSVTAGQAVGKPFKSHTESSSWELTRERYYLWVVQSMSKYILLNTTMLSERSEIVRNRKVFLLTVTNVVAPSLPTPTYTPHTCPMYTHLSVNNSRVSCSQ